MKIKNIIISVPGTMEYTRKLRNKRLIVAKTFEKLQAF